MAIRKQLSLYRLDSRNCLDITHLPQTFSLFGKMFGRSISVEHNEFLVLHSLGMSPAIKNERNDPSTPYIQRIPENPYEAKVNVEINHCIFFTEIDGSMGGLHSSLIPLKVVVDENDKERLRNEKILMSEKDDTKFASWDWNINLLPGQRFDIWIEFTKNKYMSSHFFEDGQYIDIGMSYTRYCGADAVLARQCIESHLRVNPENIELLLKGA